LFYTVELPIKKHIDNCTYEEIQPPIKIFGPIESSSSSSSFMVINWVEFQWTY